MSEIICRQHDNPYFALGLAVSFLQEESIFAQIPFQQFAGSLAGAINRKYYIFAFEGERMVGFAHWFLCDIDDIEKIQVTRNVLSYEASQDGNVLFIVSYKTLTKQATTKMLRYIQKHSPEKWLYAMRQYADGSTRLAKAAPIKQKRAS